MGTKKEGEIITNKKRRKGVNIIYTIIAISLALGVASLIA